jgi:membrane protease YdiL (CAAX protease family)
MPSAPPVRRYGAPPIPEKRGLDPNWGWLLAAVLLVPLVVYLQQFTISLESVTLERAPRERVESEEVEDPGISHLAIGSKMAVKAFNIDRAGADRDELKNDLGDLEAIAVTRVERLRAAIVAGELLGPGAALERLNKLKAEAAAGGDLARELDWVFKIYKEGPDKVPAEARESLVDRHGWFGRLALVFGKGEWDSGRRAVVGGIGGLVAIALWLLVLGLGGFIAGLIILIVWLRGLKQGAFDSGFDEVNTHSPLEERLPMEVFVLFAGGFLFLLAMRLVTFGMAAEGTSAAIAFLETLSWVLVGVLAWPLVRGIPWSRFAFQIGLHRGEGVLKELACGALAFLASIPVVFGISILVTLIFKSAGEGSDDPDPHRYPLFQPPRSNSWALVWLGALSAVVWAPFLEEVLFRGSLMRWLRPRVKWWGAVLISAAIFGAYHPYTTAGLVQVGCMGLVLALLREWRGSLIAPMTMHALHNGTITLVSILYLAAID